ncbi:MULTISPECIES: hypothetical protein [Nitratireductor]|uniref:hypothetical protein n=1 Tax=Nitratireductor TaxID=245876 RepID=UPI0013E09E27|nr:MULTISPECIES: hypothetical protein [Nitratireductor]
MQTFLLTLFLILLSIGGLALGLLFGRAPIRGSCGGLSGGDGADCAACGCKTRRTP